MLPPPLKPKTNAAISHSAARTLENWFDPTAEKDPPDPITNHFGPLFCTFPSSGTIPSSAPPGTAENARTSCA